MTKTFLESNQPEQPMPSKKANMETPPSKQNDTLKGTLYAVFGLGLFLIVSWFAVFILYLSRF